MLECMYLCDCACSSVGSVYANVFIYVNVFLCVYIYVCVRVYVYASVDA